MTVKDLRSLVDNLEEYIHVPGGIDRLKKTILHLAVSGKLVPQDPSEGTGEELYKQIQAKKQKLIAEGKLKKQKPLPEITEDEIPFEIPEIWKWSRLGGLGVTTTGKTPPTKQFSLADGTIPFAGPGDITKANQFKAVISKQISEQASQSSEIGVPGDILMVCIGGSIGKTVLLNSEACFNQQLNKVTPIGINSDYLFIALTTSYFQKLVISSAVGGATPIINQSRWSRLVVPIPALPEQLRIVQKVNTIFEFVDVLAEKYIAEQKEREKLVGSSLAHLAKGKDGLVLKHLTEIIRTKSDAAELRKTILHLAVSGKLVPQDPSEGTGEELYKQIQAKKQKLIAEGKLKKQKPLPEITEDEIPFEIPKTWKLVKLGSIGSWGSGSGFPKQYQGEKTQEIPFFKVSDMNNNIVYMDNVVNSISRDTVRKIKARILPPETIIFPKIGGAIATNKRRILRNESCIDNNCMGFIGSSKLERTWLYQLFCTWDFTQYQSGTAMPSLNMSEVASIKIALPPFAEQTRIVQKTTQLLDLVLKLEQKL